MDLHMNFSLFGEGTVIHELDSTTKYEAIRELIRNVKVFRRIKNLQEFEQSVVNREKLQSTGIGRGVAVAHGKTSDIDAIQIALGISRRGIEYDSMDGEPVNFLFLVANPPGKQMEYLMTLSGLVRMIHDQMFRQELLECTCSNSIENKLEHTIKGILAAQIQPQHS